MMIVDRISFLRFVFFWILTLFVFVTSSVNAQDVDEDRSNSEPHNPYHTDSEEELSLEDARSVVPHGWEADDVVRSIIYKGGRPWMRIQKKSNYLECVDFPLKTPFT